MTVASRAFWDERAQLDIGLHAVMTKRWTEAQCKAAHQQMEAALIRALRGADVDVTTWLDLGCGTGRLFELPFAVDPDVVRIVGVDLSGGMCRRAVREGRRNPRVEVIQATGSALPIADATVTCALSVAVLQHLDLATLRRTGAEVSRVLAPGGTLVMLEGSLDPHRTGALAGTTTTTLYSIDQFRGALGTRLSLTHSNYLNLIDDSYACLVWRKQ